MTLIVTINSRESIWLLADRRLSYKTRAPKDNAHKVMFLETSDGTAIIGYAGLGATAFGTQPADWMSNVLRGRNLPLEQSLDVLADAMKKQLPAHLLKMPGYNGPVHNTVITAFLENKVRLYSIDFSFSPDRKNCWFRHIRHVVDMSTLRTPRLGIAGSGATYLNQNRRWERSVLRIINAYDRGLVSYYTVSDHLAKLNYKVHLGVNDNSVGARCIVAWRNRKAGVHKGGGGHQFYTGTTRDASSTSLPSIGRGIDIRALLGMMNTLMFGGKDIGESAKDLDTNEINSALASLPEKPDESFR